MGRSQPPRSETVARILARRAAAAGPPYDPPPPHAYACAKCRAWHREDRAPKLYREHSIYQAGTAVYTLTGAGA